MYQAKYPLSQYACCVCKWALQGNKQQVVVIFTCIDVTQEDIIEYCEHGMDLFMEGWHPCLHKHNIFQMMGISLMMVMMNLLKHKEGIINVGDILITNENEFTMDGVRGSNGNPRSYAPMERALVHLGFIM